MSAPNPTELHLALHHQQGLAFSTPATEVLFGGAAGGGKSHLMRVASIYWSLKVPGLQTYLFRRTVQDLYKNHFTGPTSYQALLAPLIQAKLARIVKSEVRFWNGSNIWLQHCQHEKDVTNYRGYEFHALLIDELTLFTAPMYRYLRARLRMTDDFKQRIPADLQGQFPRILAGSNPGGPGHHFVKENWIEAGPMVMHRAPDLEDDDGSGAQPAGLLRQFIPSRLSDNPSLNRREYAAALRGLADPLLVRAMLDGDWSIVAGSMFGDVWREHRHICRPFAIPADWKIWRGADDGFAAALCTLWGAEDPNTGTIYVIDELYGTGILAPDAAARVLAIDRRIPIMDSDGKEYPLNQKLTGLLDRAAFSDTGGKRERATEKISRGSQMNEVGADWKKAQVWFNCRQHGWQDIYRRLEPNPRCPDKMPGLRFFPAARNIIRTLPSVLRDDKDAEDIDDPDDHCFVAGTMIETPHGSRPIESLVAGDFVMTRLGAFPIIKAWRTPAQAVITNAWLTGTPGHKIWTERGWKQLAEITRADTLCKWQKLRGSNSTARPTFDTRIQAGESFGFIFSLMAEASGFTSPFGKIITGSLFHAAGTFTTETKIRSIMTFQILRQYLLKNTQSDTCRTWCGEERHWPQAGLASQLLRSGTVARKDGNGTESTLIGARQSHSQRNFIAGSADGPSWQSLTAPLRFAETTARHFTGNSQEWMTLIASAIAEKLSVPTNTLAAKRVRGDVRQSCHIADVYNLSVAGPPEYFANGILVSNCLDALRYLLQWKRAGLQVRAAGF